MKFNKTILIFSMVIISLLAISAVSAADNATDAIEVADDSDVVAVETELDQNDEILAENDVEESIVGVPEEDAPLSENESSEVSEITIYSEGQQVSAFNFTKTNGTYNFSEILQMLNQSDLNMSNFGGFADMFNNFNFTGENKTFNFNIDGDVKDVQYKLKIVSNPQNFVFDYFVKSPNMGSGFNNITSTNLSIFENGNFLTNVTFNSNAMGMDMMSMFNVTGFENMTINDMMKMFNFQDMASQFGNATFMNDSDKNFDFKIDGEVGNIKYDLIVKSNSTDFVFDYKINYKDIEVSIEVGNLKFTSVNTAVDGKIGKNLTVTLKDQFGNAVSNKTVYIVLNNNLYTLTTDADGKVKVQVNIAKAGTYMASITFLGDKSYAGQFKTANVVVNKQTAKLTAAKKTYKAKAKTKKLTATFKSSKGNAIKGKKITFKVKGKTYTAKTNSKGVATVKVKITKKGKYNFTAKFAGDSTYKAISKSSKLILK